MTVKELKEKLKKLPDNAAVHFYIPSQDYYDDAKLVYYLEIVQEDGEAGTVVYIET